MLVMDSASDFCASINTGIRVPIDRSSISSAHPKLRQPVASRCEVGVSLPTIFYIVFSQKIPLFDNYTQTIGHFYERVGHYIETLFSDV